MTKSVTIDMCPKCKGIWFDSGELPVFVRALSASDKIKPKKIKLFQRRDGQSLYAVKEKSKSCPKCENKLTKFNYAGDSNVFLDKCSKCGGIWADGGEAKAIAEHIKDDPNATAVGTTIAKTMKLTEPIESNHINPFLFSLRLIVPLGDDAPRKRFPIVTLSIIILTILSTLVALYVDPEELIEFLDFISGDVLILDSIGSTALSTGVIGLIWNMFFLWLFGDNVEDKLGRLAYPIFYVCCGLLGVALYALLGSSLPIFAIGLSTAVSGIMGAYFILFPTANIKIFMIYKIVEVPSVLCLSIWFMFQFLYPLLFNDGTALDTACIANIGGFFWGQQQHFSKSSKLNLRKYIS